MTVFHRLKRVRADWQQLPRGASMWRFALLTLTLVYLGYSFGWWGRSSVALQAALQCISIPGSESVRYAPFTLLTGGCSGLELQSVAPSGFALLFIKDNNPHRETLYLDLRTGARHTIDLSSVPRGRFTSVGLLSDTVVLARTYIEQSDQQYYLINSQTHQTTHLTFLEAPHPEWGMTAPPITETAWNIMREADQILVGEFTDEYEIVALRVSANATPVNGIVIVTSSQRAHEQALRDLSARNIAYQIQSPKYLQSLGNPILSADAQLVARTEGVFRAFTATLIRSSGQAPGWRTWQP